MRKDPILVVALAALALCSCNPSGGRVTACGKDSDCKGDRVCVGGECQTPATTPGGVKQAPGAPPVLPGGGLPGGGSKAVTSPEQQSYPLSTIRAIADTCSNAHVTLATAPESVGRDYEWSWSRQAMLANQQFHVVSGRPSAHGEVSFEVHQGDSKLSNAWILVANCSDGATCNHLAAMYKAIVKSSRPEPLCGALPASYGAVQKSLDLLAGGPQENLPKGNDVVAKCARIAACTIATNPATTDDVGIQCQKAPSTFKLDCAPRYPCAALMACLGN